jgi:signal recognition particle receptor subunit alpha
MIDSLTILSKGGLILYQHSPTLAQATVDERSATHINNFITAVLLDPTKSSLTRYVNDGTVVEWKDTKDFLVILLYPEVVLRSSKSVAWLSLWMDLVSREYILFEGAAVDSSSPNQGVIPDTTLFDKTVDILWNQTLKNKDAGVLVAENVESNNGASSTQRKTSGPTTGKGKEKRQWGEAKITKRAMQELDFSKEDDLGDDDNGARALTEARAAYLPSADELPAWEEKEILDDNATDADSGWGSSLKGLLDQMSGNKILTDKDLDRPLEDMKQQLTSKNVASDIASEICTSVRSKLVGKKMQSFSRVKTAVRQALEDAIAKILAPNKARAVDPLRGIISKRDGGLFGSRTKKPFCIAFIGINGVGKSTSLAKIAYYLKTNGCSPMLAACDTFRSGAVEQLNVHAKCLDVPLYHKGYAKDPSAVAKAAIAHAMEQGNDVVLIDTAGRMQNNVPLMKALSKLVVENQPDLVLFVCEALVGNDGIDQLSMFDKALRSGGHVRQIDGIILTKFDTVSDKVGAALTMTHVTGAPVVFVGTGQKYTHLKKLSASSVIKSLFT